MRKIASHFILHSDGSIGKFPIIEFDQEGNIVQIREREQFVEEPSLEMVNGFLCPGFIDCIPDSIISLDDIEIKKYLNRQAISGVKVLGVSQNIYPEILNFSIKEIKFIQSDTSCVNEERGFSSVFQFLQQKKAGLDLLIKYTYDNAIFLNVSGKYGSLEVGKTPGIIAVSGMDYSNMSLNESSKIRLIK